MKWKRREREELYREGVYVQLGDKSHGVSIDSLIFHIINLYIFLEGR
jgi:hypothetical protein